MVIVVALAFVSAAFTVQVALVLKLYDSTGVLEFLTETLSVNPDGSARDRSGA